MLMNHCNELHHVLGIMKKVKQLSKSISVRHLNHFELESIIIFSIFFPQVRYYRKIVNGQIGVHGHSVVSPAQELPKAYHQIPVCQEKFCKM